MTAPSSAHPRLAGAPVLALHASSSAGAQWRGLAEALRGRHAVLAPDLLGYGATPFDPATELTSDHEIEALAPVLERLSGPVHLVGHSYGGLTALRLAASGRVALLSLTLYEPIAFWLLRLAGDMALYGEARALADAYRAAIRRGDREGAARPYLDYWNGAGAYARLSERARSALLATALKTDREWAPAFEDDTPLAALAARLPMSVLILAGERTVAPARRICDLLAAGLPGARLAIVPGAGHMGPITHGPAVNAPLAAHLVAAEGTLARAA
ncbi:MAG TPA: alpha/beta fold hydrolase [Salinarimonas sp.]|nr:alpha/beta fold hydrolase [Salinarimonas sp.]